MFKLLRPALLPPRPRLGRCPISAEDGVRVAVDMMESKPGKNWECVEGKTARGQPTD